MKDPTPVLAKPATVKEMPNSFFPKPQTVTKSPTIASIAPRTHVSKGVPTHLFFLLSLRFSHLRRISQIVLRKRQLGKHILDMISTQTNKQDESFSFPNQTFSPSLERRANEQN